MGSAISKDGNATIHRSYKSDLSEVPQPTVDCNLYARSLHDVAVAIEDIRRIDVGGGV